MIPIATRSVRATVAALACVAFPLGSWTGIAEATTSTTPTCHGHPATIVLGPDRHHVRGTDGNDVIVVESYASVDALGGNDWICLASGYSDYVAAGSGNDHIFAGRGRQELHGGGGDDVIDGGASPDQLYPGTGHDRVDAGSGDDVVYGGQGDDDVVGGGGDDFLSFENSSYGAHVNAVAGMATTAVSKTTFTSFNEFGLTSYDDSFVGGPEADIVFLEAGDDRADGGPGNDQIFGGPGDDVIDGGKGSDALYAGRGTDHVTDTRGRTYVEYNGAASGAGGLVAVTGAADDTFDIQHGGDVSIDAGGGNDFVDVLKTFTSGSIDLGPGEDTLDLSRHDFVDMPSDTSRRRTPAWTVDGGSGVDTILAGRYHGDVTMQLGPDGSVSGGSLAIGIENFENSTTGPGADDITGSDDANTMTTGAGDDTVSALGGDDTIDAGDGTDTVDGGNGNDTCTNAENVTSCEVVN